MLDVKKIQSLKEQNCACKNFPQEKVNLLDAQKFEYAHKSLKDDQSFKVANLFSELKSKWQRTEAKKNLEILDVVSLEQIQFGKGSEDSNIWELVLTNGESPLVYDFVVKNGKDGKSQKVTVGDVNLLDYNQKPYVVSEDLGDTVVLNFGIPKGTVGPAGKSAYDIYKDRGGLLSEERWLESLKGNPGDSGKDGKGIKSVKVQESAESGGINTVKFTLTDNTVNTLHVRNGKDGKDGKDGQNADGSDPQDNPETPQITTQTVVEVTQLGLGTLEEAKEYARNNIDTVFQWILIDTDTVSGDNIRKIIWHIKNNVFIDALGAVIS